MVNEKQKKGTELNRIQSNFANISREYPIKKFMLFPQGQSKDKSIEKGISRQVFLSVGRMDKCFLLMSALQFLHNIVLQASGQGWRTDWLDSSTSSTFFKYLIFLLFLLCYCNISWQRWAEEERHDLGFACTSLKVVCFLETYKLVFFSGFCFSFNFYL